MNEVSEQWARRNQQIQKGTVKFIALSESDRCHLILIIDDSISDCAC